MTKNFFLTVPYTSPLIGGPTSAIPFLGKRERTHTQSEVEAFEEARSQLDQRVGIVVQGLSGMGIRVIQLGTEEIVELFYKIFNPGETERPIK